MIRGFDLGMLGLAECNTQGCLAAQSACRERTRPRTSGRPQGADCRFVSAREEWQEWARHTGARTRADRLRRPQQLCCKAWVARSDGMPAQQAPTLPGHGLLKRSR